MLCLCISTKYILYHHLVYFKVVRSFLLGTSLIELPTFNKDILFIFIFTCLCEAAFIVLQWYGVIYIHKIHKQSKDLTDPRMDVVGALPTFAFCAFFLRGCNFLFQLLEPSYQVHYTTLDAITMTIGLFFKLLNFLLAVLHDLEFARGKRHYHEMLEKEKRDIMLNASNATTLSVAVVSNQNFSTGYVALRPFFFEVHPDRFAKYPVVREQNEKSLQIFNGYINDLFPVSTSIRPITVQFSILDKASKNLQDIKINLSGTDPIRIVRDALGSCKLPTEFLPVAPIGPAGTIGGVFTGSARSNYEDFGIDQDLLKRYLRHKRKQPMSNDLKAVLATARDQVTQKLKESQIHKVTLKEEVDDLKWRTGVREVRWEINWSESHMRRCITNIHRLLDQSDKTVRESITNALYKNILRLGSGTRVCCDGSIQFGADNVPEQWQQICNEASVRRTQIPILHESVARLRSILIGSVILIPNQRGLAQTLQQITSLIIRLNHRPEVHAQLGQLSQDTMVEIVTSYDELSIGHDGRLLVPCNVDVTSLLLFFQESAEKSRILNKNLQQLAAELETDRLDLMRELSLQSLDWEEGLSLAAVLTCIRRLRNVDEKTRELLRGVPLQLSFNPAVYVMNDGRLSIPLTWI